MRTISTTELASLVAGLPENPRVVVSGNFATPHVLVTAFDAAVPTYRLHALNAQPGLPQREGVTLETSFVGPGMRKSPHLVYIPSRLSLVPRLFGATCPPDVVIVHTSVAPEPFGRVVAEGMLSGRPVIASRAGGPAEMIRQGETGWLFAPGDARELASAIQRVLSLPDCGRATGLLASAEACKRYSLSSVLEQTDRVLSGLALL